MVLFYYISKSVSIVITNEYQEAKRKLEGMPPAIMKGVKATYSKAAAKPE